MQKFISEGIREQHIPGVDVCEADHMNSFLFYLYLLQ